MISLYEVYEGEQHIYLVMDLLSGGELFDRIIEGKVCTEENAYEIIRQLLDVLLTLKNLDIVHRDIKPQNLILKNSEGLELSLVDFGLAKKFSGNPEMMSKCGTPGYVAPEILKDEAYNHQADIFSSGVILYNLLTGCVVFQGKDIDEVIESNLLCEISYDFEADLGLSFSPEALDILKKMLEPCPFERITIEQIFEHAWIKSFETP